MFSKFKEKLGNFKKALSRTIDNKAVEIEPVIEPVPESEEGFEEEIEPIPEEEAPETLLEEKSYEVKPEEAKPEEVKPEEVKPEEVKPVTSAPSKVEIEDWKKAEYRRKLEERKKAAEIKPAEEEKVPEEKKSFFKRFSSKVGFAQKAKALVFNREVYLDSKDLEEPLWELEMGLLESDLALSVSEAIVESVKKQLTGTTKRIGSNTGDIVEAALRKAIYDVVSANTFDFDEYVRNREKPVHIVFVGINGTGKTTSIAKIAYRLLKSGYSVVLAAGDTFRAGAIDQLGIHADRLGVKMIKHQPGADPAAVIYDAVQYAKAHKIDFVLSDTAGRMHTNLNLMSQMEKICRVSTPDLIIFVDEAVAGNDAVERAAQFNEAVPIDGSILTKIDADAKGGAAISIAYVTGKPILFFGIGQGYEDLKKFDPEWFVDQLFNQTV
ncbi:MAG: signal recognition particle-docking protein FtsY [Methanosarcina thermophila]|uniref:Signal recognition particle receptor FtsY n=3 Tax=Methanosarcina thermophila TaxID=2210 RepID=A0A1I6XBW2_METTE|nr:signal recognition particle-docking protein FtsY [Methanosarcina thermophila]ALK04533.1 MAG: cell division protein FtsY [Methanosarcina sp. 795]AKB13187.1 Signal recognition particle 54 kDa protein [Methanosarcina thermophila TM-1]AKB16178.1 Signal recognition particle 54 kDa protein [Methanosarcina thermophila CHTI-55]NLU57149.1 signal recognition particle-docking protein FtsY [Methanosarcina thermophila]SFT35717.1 signal recognition particle-docking protein FtsY [Methanosarcina thermophil